MNHRIWRVGLLGSALALVGVWGAWVPHRTAALVLSGWDLGEFVKFLPGTTATRELFYLPVWCGAVTLALIANRPTSSSSRLGRLGLMALALGLTITILPPYPHTLSGYRSAEFRWQFILGVGGALAVLLSPFSRRWPARLGGGIVVTLALTGMIPAFWQFLEVRGTIEAIYGDKLNWGWGLVTFLAGWAMVSTIGVWFMMNKRAFARGQSQDE